MPSFFEFLNFLQQKIESLNPEQVIVVGTSMGGYTALLVGCLLQVNQVVVFGPYSHLSKEVAEQMRDPVLEKYGRMIEKFETLPLEVKSFFNLREVLAKQNSKTEYYVHVSRFYIWDYRRALYLRGVPNLFIIPHHYKKHAIAACLAREGRLENCFKFPYRRDNLKKYYYLLLKYRIRRLAKYLKVITQKLLKIAFYVRKS